MVAPQTTGTEPSRSAPAPLPVDVFIDRLTERGLSLTLDATGQSLLMHGPKEARTDRIRAYVKAKKADLVTHLREQEQEHLRELETAQAKRRAELVSEFGEELVAEGLAVEADLLDLQRQAMAGEDHQGAADSDSDSTGDTFYGETIRAAYAAALAGRMPMQKVDLSPGRAVSDPNFFLKTLMERGKLMRAAHGANWRDRPECERICVDIETIGEWYQRWYWTQREQESSQ